MDFYTAAIIQGFGFAALSLGIFISLKIFNIPDITTDGSYTLGGGVTAVMLAAGYSSWLVLPVALASGMLAGMSTGLIHTRLNVHPLLSGILVMTALYSVNLGIMQRSNIPLIQTDNLFTSLRISDDAFVNQLILMALVILVLGALLYWLLCTDFGIAMRATGNSEQMVRAAGINTRNMKIIGLAIANACTALSGYLVVQYQGFADINMGIGIVISGLGAVMIGESLLKLNGSGKLLPQIILVITGSVLFRLILAIALSLGLNPNYLKLITALIVLLVVSVPALKRRKYDRA
jgi:putative ABC transport system permease protein